MQEKKNYFSSNSQLGSKASKPARLIFKRRKADFSPSPQSFTINYLEVLIGSYLSLNKSVSLQVDIHQGQIKKIFELET